jgi:hypothetical protein
MLDVRCWMLDVRYEIRDGGWQCLLEFAVHCVAPIRHSREGGNPVGSKVSWIPAFL